MTEINSLTIAVLYGGDSAEREVSLNSGAAIAKGLTASGATVHLIDTQGYCLSNLTELNLDLVFIALHGRGGEDGCVQGALEYMNIPYTGSGVLGSALSMDKIRSKQVMQAANVPTAPFSIVEKHRYQVEITGEMLAELGGKVMVKPAHEGSSIGMSMAATADELANSLANAFQYDDEVLVEAWIEGPEYTVAIVGDIALPAIHMETPNEFYDYEAKYQLTTTQYHCPCHLGKDDEQALQALALKTFRATGANGWGRVDVMRNQQNQWQVLEVNTVPGMTETSLVPKAANVYGWSFIELVKRIAQLALSGSK